MPFILLHREKFDGLISIVDSLRKQGLTYDQAVKESSKLIERYQNLLVQVAAETEAQEALSKDLETFDSLRDGTLAWIMGLKESIDTVRSTEGSKSMIEERIQRTEVRACKALCVSLSFKVQYMQPVSVK